MVSCEDKLIKSVSAMSASQHRAHGPEHWPFVSMIEHFVVPTPLSTGDPTVAKRPRASQSLGPHEALGHPLPFVLNMDMLKTG